MCSIPFCAAEHVFRSYGNYGILQASLQRIESNNQIVKDWMTEKQNGDCAQGLRWAMLSDLQKLARFEFECIDYLAKEAARISSRTRSLLSEEFVDGYDFLVDGFVGDWQLIYHEFVEADWTKDASDELKELYARKSNSKARKSKVSSSGRSRRSARSRR